MSELNLVCGEAIDVMRGFSDATFDAVVTDPPFGIGKVYETGRERTDSPATYWQWFSPFFCEFQRLVKPGGLMAIWQSQVHFKYFWQWFGQDIHIYAAAKNFVQIRKRAPWTSAYDPVVMLYKPGASPLRPVRPARNLDFYVANTAAIVSDPTRIERAHPYPRPLDAVIQIVGNFVVDGGFVLDPFLGSGTTMIACARTDRSCCGIEIEPRYCALAKKRIASTIVLTNART